jgi:transposase
LPNVTKTESDFQKKTISAPEKEREEVLKKRLEFWKKVREIPAENLVFIDESGVNLGLDRLFARSKKGTRARGKRPDCRGSNVSIIGAIALNGVLAQSHLIGSTDRLTFEAFVSQVLVPQLWPGAYVVMDNYSIHKGQQVQALIEAAGAKVIYLPPYSPEFNPIENYWSKLKSILRKISARTYESLVAAIKFALEQVSFQDIRHWFIHSCYCTSLD